jgi:hypothetical protein
MNDASAATTSDKTTMTRLSTIGGCQTSTRISFAAT